MPAPIETTKEDLGASLQRGVQVSEPTTVDEREAFFTDLGRPADDHDLIRLGSDFQ